MLEMEDVSQAVFGLVLGAQVALLERAKGACPLAGVVHPAHQIIVAGFFTDAAEVSGKVAADDVGSFAHAVAGHAAARLKQLFAAARIAWRLVCERGGLDTRLPNESGDGLDLVLFQAELGHLGGRAKLDRKSVV